MSATEPRKPGITPAELRDDLEHLIFLATEMAVAQERLETFAKAVEEANAVETSNLPYASGVTAEVSVALGDAQGQHGSAGFTALHVAQSVQDALDVLDLALARMDTERVP